MNSSVETAVTDRQQCAPEAQVASRSAELIAQDVDYLTFYKAFFGPEGLVMQLFPTEQTRKTFLESESGRTLFSQMERLLYEEDKFNKKKDSDRRPLGTFTPRLPGTMRSDWHAHAQEKQTSMNKVIIALVLKMLAARGDQRDPLDETTIPQQESPIEGTQMVTIRMPSMILDAIHKESHRRWTSMNKLFLYESNRTLYAKKNPQGTEASTPEETGEPESTPSTDTTRRVMAA